MAERILPHAKAMVLCEDVNRHPDQGTIDLLGVRTTIEAESFPSRHRQLSVYLEMTCHEGVVPGFINAMNAQTEEEVFRGPTHSIRFPNPLVIIPVLFRMRNCLFPEPGLYWIQFYCHEMLIIEHRLTLS
jgi:hypothetical protein